MAFKIWISGKLYDKEDAKISVYDHGLLYGDGVFEGMRSYGGKVFRLEEHLDRLWNSAKAIWLEIPMTREAMAKAVNDTLAANGIKDGYIRLVVTRGSRHAGARSEQVAANPQIIIITDHIALYPQEFYEKGLKIITASTVRNHPAALSPRIKSLNYLNNILAKIEGLQAGCVEALMLNHKGEVAECTGDNIFSCVKAANSTRRRSMPAFWKASRATPSSNSPASRASWCTKWPSRGTTCSLPTKCFLTGSAAEVIPVVKVDSRIIGDGKPGPVTRDLEQRFHELTRR